MLRGLRGDRKIAQRAIARTVGISLKRYWSIENGELAPTELERKRIAEVLGVRVADIAWPALLVTVPIDEQEQAAG